MGKEVVFGDDKSVPEDLVVLLKKFWWTQRLREKSPLGPGKGHPLASPAPESQEEAHSPVSESTCYAS